MYRQTAPDFEPLRVVVSCQTASKILPDPKPPCPMIRLNGAGVY
jgi:hypothetical protein